MKIKKLEFLLLRAIAYILVLAVIVMATLHEYFETDFSNTIRVHVKIPFLADNIESRILYDFEAYCAFVACYINNPSAALNYFVQFITNFQHGAQVLFDNHVTLPSVSSSCFSAKVS